MSEGKRIFRDLQTGGFSAHTTLEGLSSDLYQDMLSSSMNEAEAQVTERNYGNTDEKTKCELIELYEYAIEEPTPKLIKEWENYHNMDWEGN